MHTPAPRTVGLRTTDVTYPGGTEHIRAVRADLHAVLRDCPRADDVILCASELATNAASESLNRLAKLEARLAYGFRNPANQRRRVGIACARGRRRKSRTATSKRTRPVTGPKPHPGYGNFEEPI